VHKISNYHYRVIGILIHVHSYYWVLSIVKYNYFYTGKFSVPKLISNKFIIITESFHR